VKSALQERTVATRSARQTVTPLLGRSQNRPAKGYNSPTVVRRVLLLLFFASGCAALIYEIVWFYLVELIVGASSISVAVLLASFMGGMALGSLLLPRVVPLRWHPLRIVAMLELGIGTIGILMPLLLPAVQAGYVALAGGDSDGVLLRAAVSAVVLIPPTLLMGATLPAVARWTRTTSDGAATVGLLYMANIAGGAFGTALAGFYLLRLYDTIVASVVAASLNIAVAAVLWWLAARSGEAPEDAAPSRDADVTAASSVATAPAAIYLVAALSGFTALGAEVVWTRQVSLLFGASVYTFSLILAIFLAGLGTGSVIGAGLGRRQARAARALGICQVLLVVSIAWAAWAIVNLLPKWQPTQAFLPWVRSTPSYNFAFDALRCLVAFGPATLCWGASFPLAIAAASARHAAESVSRVNAINTVGALLGALGLTLIGIPVLGSTHAQQTLVACAAVSAAILLLNRSRAVISTLTAAAIAAAAAVGMAVVPPVPGALIAYGRSVNSWDSIKTFLYVAEGATASVAVTEGVAGARQFHIAGKVEASDMDIDMRLERMLGHIPALMHQGPARNVLVVGNGAGVTAGALAAYPDAERIVICEIEPVVPASAREYFRAANNGVLDDPRVTVVYDDGRHFLQTTTEKFDIITTDPIHPWVRGAATLYSLEYLQLVRAHLAPGGVVTQWVPLYETDAASVKSQLATFAQVFPEMTLWNPDLLEEGYDLVVLGQTETAVINEVSLDIKISQMPTVQQSLTEISLPSGASVLSTYAGRTRDLAPWLADASINRERHLRLQYLAGLAFNSDDRYGIFRAIVDHRRYPADLFMASAETEMQLRGWYERY
jgi:spermidine synthase